VQHAGETDMKTIDNNLSKKDLTNKFGSTSLRKIRRFLNLNKTAIVKADHGNSLAFVSGYSMTREDEAYQIEAERKQNEARIYVNVFVPMR
jgi:hypothetical protein